MCFAMRIISQNGPRTFRPRCDRTSVAFLAIPADYMQHGTYARAHVDPVALVKQEFTDAFEVIHAIRPDFDSDAAEPIRIIPKD